MPHNPPALKWAGYISSHSPPLITLYPSRAHNINYFTICPSSQLCFARARRCSPPPRTAPSDWLRRAPPRQPSPPRRAPPPAASGSPRPKRPPAGAACPPAGRAAHCRRRPTDAADRNRISATTIRIVRRG
eukprot:1191336-Prorocentrum_minimum.AAC.1